MLVIRADQMKVSEQAALGRFEDEMVGIARNLRPALRSARRRATARRTVKKHCG